MRMSRAFQLSNVLGNVYDWLTYIDGLLTEREVFTVKYRLAFLSLEGVVRRLISTNPGLK